MGSSYRPEHDGQVVTVEKTAKRFKLSLLLAAFMIIGGIIWLLSHLDDGGQISVGVMLIVAGVLWRIVTKVRIWWNHG